MILLGSGLVRWRCAATKGQRQLIRFGEFLYQALKVGSCCKLSGRVPLRHRRWLTFLETLT